MPRLARSDVAEEMHDHALRQVVGFQLVRYRQGLKFRHEPPVAPDHAPHEARMPEVVEAALLAVALSGAVDEREGAG